jgi:hypothetical protein
MKYIFVAGAPGSKWSSVVKNIYYSPSIDSTDYSDKRTYYHDASGIMDLMHLGAYFDPGMEFGKFFHRLSEYDYYRCETEFDAPFSGTGVRIIKSHVFANHIDYIKQTWPDCPIVLVHREDDACLGWWVKCGHFDITYPDYAEYYKNLKTTAGIIKQQNQGITDAMYNYKHKGLKQVSNNLELCDALNIARPSSDHTQNYLNNDIKVSVI